MTLYYEILMDMYFHYTTWYYYWHLRAFNFTVYMQRDLFCLRGEILPIDTVAFSISTLIKKERKKTNKQTNNSWSQLTKVFFSHQVYRWHRFYQTGVFGANDVPGLIVFDTSLIIYSLLSSPTEEKGHCRVLVDGRLWNEERDCGRQNFRLYAYSSTVATSTATGIILNDP